MTRHSKFRVSQDTEIPKLPVRASGGKARRQFLAGPLDLPTIQLIARKSHLTLAVWLAINHRWRLRGGKPFTLTHALIEQFGVKRSSKARAIGFLRCEGLIRVAPHQRGKGVTIEWVQETHRRSGGIE